MQELIDKIKQKGYWLVTIRPAEFVEDRVKTRDELKKFVEKNKVELRGWDYPHVDGKERGIFNSGKDSVASFSDWPVWGHFEYWQLYQNGLFIHYLAMREDYDINDKMTENIKKSLPFTDPETVKNKFLGIVNTTYLVTEIFTFASRLAKEVGFGENTIVEIELNDVSERTLFIGGDFFRGSLLKAYTCLFHNENIKKKINVKTEDLILNHDKLAVDMIIDIFSDFNWTNVTRNVIEADQKKLVERRL